MIDKVISSGRLSDRIGDLWTLRSIDGVSLADSLPEVEEEGGLHIAVLPGVHGAVRQGSPSSLGASLDVILDSPKRPIWVSLQYLSQEVQWTVRDDDNIRRDHHYVGRVRLGLGRRQGPRIYALFEKGKGVIKADPSLDLEDEYDLQGFGLGVGLAVGRFTVSFEAVLGLETRYEPDLYGRTSASLHYRLLRIPRS